MSKTIQIMIDKRGAVTNGDVIKAMFPSAEVIETYEGIINTSLDNWTPFSKEWWNSPYKESDSE